MNPGRSPALLALLGLPAWVYGRAVRMRNRYYDREKSAARIGLPVLSVGNLTVGGTGKTPVVAWLVRWLQREGRAPAVLSRGYGGDAGKGPLVVSSGAGPGVDSGLCGDEPYLLAHVLPGARVIVGSDRVAGALAARSGGADVIVLDDGFQHRRLARDLDLVLLDAGNPFGNYRLLPAGILREPVSGLRRADAVLITRARPGESLVVIEKVVRRHNSRVPILRAGHARVGFVDSARNAVRRPERAVCFCGIGNPRVFAADLDAEGIEVASLRVFPDHHRYLSSELVELAELARRANATLLTTEKDLARMPSRQPELPVSLAALRIETQIHDQPALDALLRQCLAEFAP